MAIRKLIERIVWEAQCANCGETKLIEDAPPRARLCNCGTWVDYHEKKVIAPDLGLPGYK